MKVQLISDIHLEYYSEYPGLHYFVKPIADILVLLEIFVIININFLNFFQEAFILNMLYMFLEIMNIIQIHL